MMKSVTEFASFTLTNALKTKTSLAGEGKSPEEIEAAFGESTKFEGEKLKHFMSAMDVAAQHPEGLKRVLVLSLNEGEKAPPKSVQVESVCYVPDFYVAPKPPAPKDAQGGRGGRGGRGGKGGPGGGKGGPGKGRGEKESPWGPSPEQIAAKKNKGAGAPVPKS
jgi:hypothetical protein